ncbi:hypothetical protein WDW86_05375 [Bdellovibrionota bacterium FG-2]
MKLRFELGLVFAVFAVFTTRPLIALAASCCAGSGGQSLCVLPSEQRYEIGVTTSFRAITGEFDPYGNYTANKDSSSYYQINTVVGGAYRLGEDWQAGVSVPVISNHRTFSGKALNTTGMGDPTVEARYTFWEDLAFLPFRPQLTFYSGVRLPFGKTVYDSPDPYGLDSVSDGTTHIHAGFTAAKLYRPLRASIDGAYFYPIARTVDSMRGAPISSPYQYRAGNRFQLNESASYLVNQRWSGTLGMRQLWVLQDSINKNAVDGSAQRLFSSLASLNYFPTAAWALSMNYETVFPFYRYLANQPNAQSVALGLTYGGY